MNDHLMHFTERAMERKHTYFLLDVGTCALVLGFKPLYRLLGDKYRIAIIEEAGYGFIAVTDSKRDIHTILHETRDALQQAKIERPYILLHLRN